MFKYRSLWEGGVSKSILQTKVDLKNYKENGRAKILPGGCMEEEKRAC